MKRSLLGLLLISGPAWAGLDPPDTVGCHDRFDKMSFFTDKDEKGTCVSQMINTPDFSVPGPPTFKVVATLVCVASPRKHAAKDFFAVVGGAFVVFGLIIYNLFRRRTLSDYE